MGAPSFSGKDVNNEESVGYVMAPGANVGANCGNARCFQFPSRRGAWGLRCREDVSPRARPADSPARLGPVPLTFGGWLWI